jgi:hypothetical protein
MTESDKSKFTYIGRKKYAAEDFQEASRIGRKLCEEMSIHKFLVHDNDVPTFQKHLSNKKLDFEMKEPASSALKGHKVFHIHGDEDTLHHVNSIFNVRE